jgi:ESX secretion-associated protein EspG
MSTVSLTPAQYDIVWNDLRLGEQPYPVAVRSQGRTMEERALIRNRVYGELTARRLAEGPRLDPGLADALALLAGAPTSVDMIWLPERDAKAMRNALVVASGDHGLLAELTTDGLRLHALRASGIVAALLALLPSVPAASGPSITVPIEALVPAAAQAPAAGTASAAAPQDSIYAPEPRSAGRATSQLRSLEALFATPRLRGGQLGANVRDRRGGRSRSRPLEWFDTQDGRYMAQTSTGVDGPQHLLVTPADNARIAHRVHDMLAALG